MWDWSGGEERFLVFGQKPRRLFWPETRMRSVMMHIAKLENPRNRSKKLTQLLVYWQQCIVHERLQGWGCLNVGHQDQSMVSEVECKSITGPSAHAFYHIERDPSQQVL
jgi:hypothetical protein